MGKGNGKQGKPTVAGVEILKMISISIVLLISCKGEFKMNPFKPKDKICFYHNSVRYKGVVTEVIRNLVIAIENRTKRTYHMHWKQCRKLKPKQKEPEPKKFWAGSEKSPKRKKLFEIDNFIVLENTPPSGVIGENSDIIDTRDWEWIQVIELTDEVKERLGI